MKRPEGISSAALWGLWGIIATILTASGAIWNQERALGVFLLACSGVLLFTTVVFTIYRPLRSLAGHVESLREHFDELLRASADRRVSWSEFLLMVIELTSQASLGR